MGAENSNKELNDRMQDDGAYQANSISSNYFYRSLFANHPDIVYHLDFNGNIVEANASFTQVLGYTPEEISNNLSQLYTEDQLQRRMDYFNKARQGEAQNFNLSASNKEGSIVELDIVYIPNLLDGQVVSIFGIAKDITVSNYLQESYKSLFANLSDTAFILDLDGNVLDVNDAALKSGGYTQEDVRQKPFHSFVFPEHKEQVFAPSKTCSKAKP
ncbi:PAS domain-containing protein [Paenibacillus taihuensis]|uniref:PAS domain-containing protein n=1 Tax=Paenibacillus taihuensis TaxID=1156355 RepID=UPI0015F2887F|nr:PAS domain-containing protein [Paenibacillus taihuensis]